ncbi:SWIM zinc finger family protein [Haloarculaceae archaeon H-GB2-1]|nr:SWIM zinc finger family protein [Haloarculaceae archaeon H-GB1-1]MEA5410064.1 SWIM zinc finger family protein [Haloarculaceae archaeon H-GB2-1]
MTPSRITPASHDDASAFDDELDETSRRAWTEAMSVRPFGDSYLVDAEDGTHFVSLGESNCSCDAANDPCKHIRRVAIEINIGRLPPPDGRTVECPGCGDDVPISAAQESPTLCRDCDLQPGDLVVDAEGSPETPLIVVSSPGPPAELVPVSDAECTVADYPGNGDYDSEVPVVEVIYPQAVSTDRPPRRYLFPVTRLAKPTSDHDGSLSGYSTAEND